MKLRGAVAAAIISACAVSLLASPATAATDPARCLVAAHRGDTNVSQTTRTEEGMAAFRAATGQGADLLEADASPDANDVMWLNHDLTVDRTTNGTGTVRARTTEYLAGLRLVDGYEGLARMTDLLTYAQAQPNVQVLLELKSMGGQASWDSTVAAITALGVDRVVVQSQNTAILDRMRLLLPELRLAWIVLKQQPTLAQASRYGGLVIDYTVLTATYRASLPGVELYPYLESSPTAAWSRDAGHVAAIITNKPGSYMAWRKTAAGCAL